MKECPTRRIDIYVGLKEGYNGIVHTYEEAEEICQKYCDEVGLGLTLTRTKFIYTDGNEPGVIVGLINYPRFYDPKKSPQIVWENALKIAYLLKSAFKQERVSIVDEDRTVMLEDDLATKTLDEYVQLIFSGIMAINPTDYSMMLENIARELKVTVKDVEEAVRRMPAQEID